MSISQSPLSDDDVEQSSDEEEDEEQSSDEGEGEELWLDCAVINSLIDSIDIAASFFLYEQNNIFLSH